MFQNRQAYNNLINFVGQLGDGWDGHRVEAINLGGIDGNTNAT